MATYGEQIQEAVAAQIRAELAAAGLTKADLARMTGKPENTIGRYLNGQRDIPWPVYADIAHALKLTVHELAARAQRRLDGIDVQ